MSRKHLHHNVAISVRPSYCDRGAHILSSVWAVTPSVSTLATISISHCRTVQVPEYLHSHRETLYEQV